MAKYKIKPGQYHWHKENGKSKLFGEGDVLDLTPQQFRSFRDKFVPATAEGQKALEPKDLEKRARLEMKHHGGGRYHVFNSDSGKRITDNFVTKAEATDLVERG